MNYRENLTWASIAPLLLLIGTGATVLAVPGRPAMADLIKYKWSGTMTPLEANVDPWEIGASKPFFISVTVDDNSDDFDTDVRDARFNLSDAVLLIDGVPATVLNGRRMFFGDRDSRDLVSISLDEVEFNGVREMFFTGTGLPASTFTFATDFESPPLFPETKTITGGGATSESSSYFTVVSLGTTVTVNVIPEPSTFILGLFAILGAGIMCWRNRIR